MMRRGTSALLCLLATGCFRGGFVTWETAADASNVVDTGPGDGTALDAGAGDATADAAPPDGAALDVATSDGANADAAPPDGAALDMATSDGAADDAGVDAGPAIVARIHPSRLDGVAPLAVFFDASTTVAHGVADPVHALEFSWSFGDPGAGTWPTSGLPRNRATGPVAAHVFQTAGDYLVELRVRHGADEATAQKLISVADPDAVFAGDNTVCLSNAGDFTGAPTGCRQVTTTADFSEILAELAPGRRLLLRRGESWTSSTWLHPNVAGPGLLGAFGSGPRPVIVQTGNDVLLKLSGSVPLLADWRVQDLQIVGSGGDQSTFIGAGGQFSDVLVQRVDMTNLAAGVCVHDSILDYLNTHGSPGHELFRGLFVVECTASAMVSPGGGMVCYRGRQLAVLGNDLQPGSASGGRLLDVAAEGAVIAHNRLRSLASGLIGIDGLVPSSTGVTRGVRTERVIIADNDLALTADALWPLAVRTNNSPSGHIQHVRVERNLLRGPAQANAWALLTGSQLLVRNNVLEVAAGDKCLGLGPGAPDLPPADYRVLHNTCSVPGSDDVRLIYVQPGLPGVEIANNLVVSDGTTGLLENGSEPSVVTAGNLLLTRAALVAGSLYELPAGSPAIDAADPAYSVDLDLRWQPRPLDGDGSSTAESDVGACEYVPGG